MEEKECSFCGEVYKKRNLKYCSQKCQWLSRRKRVFIKCKVCGKEIETCPSAIKNGKKFCSNECLYKAQKGRKLSDKHVRNIIKGQHKSPNKTEQRLIKVIEKYNLPFKFVGAGDFIIEGKNPDFIHLSKKMLIEVNGDFFVHTQRDVEEKTEFYHQHGWKVLNLTDGDVEKSSIEELKNIVETFEQTGVELPINMKFLDNHITKICEQCGQKYETVNTKQKYCSRKCWVIYQKSGRTNTKIIKICKTCGKKFKVWKGREKSAKYCSRKCYSEKQRTSTNIEKTCKICGDIFKCKKSLVNKRIFCSRECYYESRREKFIKKCLCCNVKFYVIKSFKKRKYCSNKCKFISYKRKKKVYDVI